VKNETLNYKAKIAIKNYSVVFVMIVLMVILSRDLGDSNELLMLKIAVVPLFFLSFAGLRSIYRDPIIEHRLTLRSVEFSVLDGLLYSLFIFISLWKQESTIGELLILFGSLFFAFTLLKLFFLVVDVRKISSLRSDQTDRE